MKEMLRVLRYSSVSAAVIKHPGKSSFEKMVYFSFQLQKERFCDDRSLMLAEDAFIHTPEAEEENRKWGDTTLEARLHL